MTPMLLRQTTDFLIEKIFKDTKTEQDKSVDDLILNTLKDEVKAYRATVKTLEASDMQNLDIFKEVNDTREMLEGYLEHLENTNVESDEYMEELRKHIRMNAIMTILK